MDEIATCREYVRPRLESAGWNDDTHLIIEQKTFTDGRIVPTGRKIKRRPQKRADYLLCYTRDFPIAVVEAKAEYKTALLFQRWREFPGGCFTRSCFT